MKHYKQCLRDIRILHKKKLEALLQAKIQEHQNQKKSSPEKEVSSHESKIRDKRLLKQDEVYNGALEDILLSKFITLIID